MSVTSFSTHCNRKQQAAWEISKGVEACHWHYRVQSWPFGCTSNHGCCCVGTRSSTCCGSRMGFIMYYFTFVYFRNLQNDRQLRRFQKWTRCVTTSQYSLLGPLVSTTAMDVALFDMCRLKALLPKFTKVWIFELQNFRPWILDYKTERWGSLEVGILSLMSTCNQNKKMCVREVCWTWRSLALIALWCSLFVILTCHACWLWSVLTLNPSSSLQGHQTSYVQTWLNTFDPEMSYIKTVVLIVVICISIDFPQDKF